MPREKDPFRYYVEFLKNSDDPKKIEWKCNFCNKKYSGSVTRIKAHLAGRGGFGINSCEAVNDRVRSEAEKALKGKGVRESTNGSEGNAEEPPHEPVTANNEDGRRDTSFNGMPSSSFYMSETDLPSQSTPAQITVPEMDASLWMQLPYSYPGDSYPPQLNFNHTSTSQDVAPQDLTNRPRPVNAEARGPCPEVPQDARTYDAPMDSLPDTSGLVDESVLILKRKLEELSRDTDELEARCDCERAKRVRGECWSLVQAFQEGRSLASQQQVKKVDDLTKEVEDILGRCSFRKGSTTHLVGYRKNLPLVTTELVGNESEKTIKRICDYLMQEEISVIGIHGMGGVGKTAILMHVHNRVRNHSAFNDVFWVTAPQEFNIYELQDEIANAVGLENISKDRDIKRRACILNEHLKKKKRAVLILDDLWMHFDVEDVGIPIEKGGIKLVMTTRSLHVCHKMLCQVHIKIEPLGPPDGWSLFLKKLCFTGELPPKIEEIMKSIVDKCRGLPLGIIEIATRMRGAEAMHEWKRMLRKLKDSEVKLDVFKRLELSYVNLDDSQAQRCFLHLVFCFGFEKDLLDAEELIESLIDEDLLGGIDTLQELHDEGNTILDKLKKDGLCAYRLWSCVIHPLMIDMALHVVGSATHMVKAHKGLKEIPEDKFWTDRLEKVFLQGNEIENIPYGISPNCPKLTRLSLNGNDTLEAIHGSFFRHLNGLKVVDLSDTGLEELPDSISELESLEALLLRGCKDLRRVPCVQKLGSLKKLDLLGCAMLEEAPKGMEMLVKLRHLDLGCTKIEVLPERLLEKMLNLQYLIIGNVEGEPGKFGAEGLCCSAQNVAVYNMCARFLKQNSIRQYALALGETSDDFSWGFESRSVSIEGWHGIAARGDRGIGGDDRPLIPENTQQLEIRGCDGMTSLRDVRPFDELEGLRIEDCEKLEEVGAVRFPQLRVLIIGRCPKLKHLWEEGQLIHIEAPRLESIEVYECGEMKRGVKWEWLTTTTGLPNLKDMRIWGCEKLEEIIGGPFPRGATCLLQTLFVSGCHSMKVGLLTHDVWPHLPFLQDITIGDCKGIEVIIGTAPNTTPSSSSSSSSFPKLTELSLWNLPELKSICDGTLVCDSIELIEIRGCPKLKRMPLKLPLLDDGAPSPPPSLQLIWIDQQTWNSLEWDDPRARSSLQHLCQLF